MNQQISDARAPARRSGIVPDQEGGGDSFQLPEKQERNPIVSQHNTDGRTDISHRTKRFQRALVMTAVYTANQPEYAENHRENPAQGIHIKIVDREICQKLESQIRSKRNAEHTDQRQDRTTGENHPAFFRRAKRSKKADKDKDDTRMEILKHRNHRILSHNNLRRAAAAAS